MNPRHLIDRMLAQGYVGELASIIALGAAMAIRRGVPPELTSIQDPTTGQPVPSDVEAMLHKMHAATVAELQGATEERLDHAIALYTAHLKAAGYSVEAGYVH